MTRLPAAKNPDIQLLERLVGNGNVVTVHTFMIDLTGDHIAAIVLEQLLYWRARSTEPKNIVAKSDADWYKETRVSERQMRRVRAWFIANKIVVIKRLRSKFYGGQPVWHYTVDMGALDRMVIKTLGTSMRLDVSAGSELNEPSSSKVNGSSTSQPDKTAGSYTETIAETTTEKIVANATPPAKKAKPAKKDKPADPDNEAIKELIHAWKLASSTIDPAAFGKKVYRDSAREMHHAGITPDDVTAYTRIECNSDYWRGKSVAFTVIAKGIVAWKATQAKQAAAHNASDFGAPNWQPDFWDTFDGKVGA
jgi:hypothetical protein